MALNCLLFLVLVALESKPSLEKLELEARILKSILLYWFWLLVVIYLEKAGLA